jgi:hypothetical protein
LKLANWLNITNKLIVLSFLFSFAHAQNARMERLNVQYVYSQTNNAKVKDELRLIIADKYNNEGDHKSALDLIEKTNKDSVDQNAYLFCLAKSNFLANENEASIGYLQSMNKEKLSSAESLEWDLFLIVNYNHMLQFNQALDHLNQTLLKNGKDTSGISSFFKEKTNFKSYSLKKASRRSRIFPGAGLFYVKEPKKAVTSIFLNVGFLGYTAYSIYTKYYVTAALTGVAQFLRFYNGGRKASINFASKKNNINSLNSLVALDEFCEKKLLDIKK